MKILVDADACPAKQIIVRLAKQRNIPVTMLIDTAHELHDGYSRIITVDKQADSVDYALMGLLAREDIAGGYCGDAGLWPCRHGAGQGREGAQPKRVGLYE